MSNLSSSFPYGPDPLLHSAHVYIEQIHFFESLGAFSAKANGDTQVAAYVEEEIRLLRPRYLSNALVLRKTLVTVPIAREFLRKNLNDQVGHLSPEGRDNIFSIPQEPMTLLPLISQSTNPSPPSAFYQQYVSERFGLFKIFEKISSEIMRLQPEEILGYELPPKCLSLTFDDGPSEKTPGVLDMLSEFNIRGTFFVLGKNVAGRENTVREIRRRGHEVGHHAWSHKPLPSLSDKEIAEEFEKTRAILKTCIADPSTLFRAPYGQRDLRVLAIAKAGGERHILWNIDSRDWNRSLSDDAVSERVLRLSLLNDGGVILFHDTLERAQRVLPIVLEFLKQEGMLFH